MGRLACIVGTSRNSLPSATSDVPPHFEWKAIHETAAWASLKEQASLLEGVHLRELIADADRCAALTAEHSGIFYDYSRQRVTNSTMDALFSLAEVCLSVLTFFVPCLFGSYLKRNAGSWIGREACCHVQWIQD